MHENRFECEDNGLVTQGGVRWEICADCEGDGTHVHEDVSVPSQDMLDDDDAMHAYWRGDYDVVCRRCEGSGKVRPGQTTSLRRGAPGQYFEHGGRLYNEASEPMECGPWGA